MDDGSILGFRHIVGADGSNSIVRRYLHLPTKRKVVAFEHRVGNAADRFAFFLDDHLFGDGYAWVFPNRDVTSVGCCSSNSSMKAARLRQGFLEWLKNHAEIDVSASRLRGATINCDYQGYRFGPIFLAGDAAGLASSMTGKGIYPACISGKQIAHEILGADENDDNLITKWLAKKSRHDAIGALSRHPLILEHLR